MIARGHKIPVVLLGGLLTMALLSGQDKPRETVTVTAVEIPVRVFDGNGFIGGLARDDFEVFENGVRQDITGFEAVSRSILPLSVEMPQPVPKTPRKRNFLLVFNVFAYTDRIGQAVDFFFQKVFSPGDRLAVLVNEAPVQIKGDGRAEEIAARLKDLLLDVKKKYGAEFERILRYMENRTDSIRLALENNEVSDYWVSDSDMATPALRFFDDYQRAWNEFRKLTLGVNLDVYKAVARRMGKLDGDTWAIGFRQRPVFPRIRTSGRLAENLSIAIDSQIGADAAYNLVQTKQQELERSFDVNNDFPGEAIKDIFAQANITYHVLLMKAVVARGGSASENLDVREVQAEYEDVLRRISRDTGGLTVFSNNVVEALMEASAKPDQYYLLVYQPAKGVLEPGYKIEVRVKRQGTRVVSLKERTPGPAGGIAIHDFKAGSRAISFRLKDFRRAPLEWKEQGRAVVKVTVFDDRSAKVFSKETTFDLVNDNALFSLDLPSMAAGDHFILIEAHDIVGGEKAVFSQSVRFK